MHKITVDRTRRLVEVRLEGFLDVAAVRELRQALLRALAENGLAPGGFVQLVDTTRFPIQTQAVYGALSDFAYDPAMMSAKLAIQAGGSPSKMQARRSVLGCPHRICDTRAEALAWLYSDTSQLASAAA
jgi:hypothetical protein